MEFDITKVTIDGDVDDLSDEQLRELVGKFQDAQESNVAEFENAAEVIGELDETEIEDFEEAKNGLIEEITGAEAFDEVPVTEATLTEANFGELREWRDFVGGESAEEETDDVDEDDDDVQFDDMGKQSETDTEDATDFIDKELEGIQGLTL